MDTSLQKETKQAEKKEMKAWWLPRLIAESRMKITLPKVPVCKVQNLEE